MIRRQLVRKLDCINLFQELRTRLDQLLEYKISHPGSLNWNCYSTEGAVLR